MYTEVPQAAPAAESSTSGATRTETFRVSGSSVMEEIRRIVHEGNVRRIIVRNSQGKRVIEFPLTVGVVGAVLLPVWAALAVVAAVATDASIEVERIEASETIVSEE